MAGEELGKINGNSDKEIWKAICTCEFRCEARMGWQFWADWVPGSLAPALNSEGWNENPLGSCLYISSPGECSLWQRDVGISDLNIWWEREVVLKFLTFASSIIISLKNPKEIFQAAFTEPIEKWVPPQPEISLVIISEKGIPFQKIWHPENKFTPLAKEKKNIYERYSRGKKACITNISRNRLIPSPTPTPTCLVTKT